jgi:endonuclease/exonuclease/phosphatase family metal-dependent hydrolase
LPLGSVRGGAQQPHSLLSTFPPPTAASLSIFATTLNLGKAKPPSAAEVCKWLPEGRDLYAIAVQECSYLEETVAVLLETLGGERWWSVYVQAIGGKAVGGCIAIVVLAKRQLESAGALKSMRTASGQVKRGKKLLPEWLLERASNKGAVGCAFRFHGTAIAFVGCHLASNKGETSKVGKRIEDTRAMLEGLDMAYDSLGFELPLSCHHVVLMGDLNYRVTMPADSALRLMEQGDWSALRAADELMAAIGSGTILHSFWESPIQFLPSYRRVIGQESELPEATDGSGVPRDVLDRSFTTFVKGGERTPSYTDRVLCCSLPGLEPQLTCERYSCCESVTISDHRPVSAELTVRAWRPSDGSGDGEAASQSGAPASRRMTWASRPRAPRRSVRCRLSLTDLELSLMGSVAQQEASGRSAASQVGLALTQAAELQLVFPMPAEDPSFALNRIAWLVGKATLSAHERVPWHVAERNGVTGTAELDVSSTRVVHALVKLIDADGRSVGQGVVAVPLPWLTGPAEGGARDFEAQLVRCGQHVGDLRGRTNALFGR